ncbi:mRNA decay activator protein ZFP36-like [Astyanax mexicanus]|uniref:mRNA decay activator protein ZFP36 n=1 Tax=Astyanax mexicanus TaxID=7994 RepID=A0A8B9K2K5_ASTMX|nr:mRNA decay activator protein ZFP36-like [Astyanax mexicanus]
MSDTYDDILMNLVNIGLNDHFLQEHVKPSPPHRPSLFSAKSLSSEQLSDEWPFDIWSENSPSTPQLPYRADRSMSLTDSLTSLPAFGKPKAAEVPPPPGFPPLAPQPSNRYKTELCRSFQEHGTCKYGNKCQFAHGENELRGLYRHPKYKTEACRTFYNFGYCPYGSRCHFIHEDKASDRRSSQHSHQIPTQHPRLLRQSVSFAGFLGARSASPPTSYEPTGFTRAPSVSPPPADSGILSPVFSDASRDMFTFPQVRRGGAVITAEMQPRRSSCCVCHGHGNGNGNSFQATAAPHGKENRLTMQRFPSDDSLSDRESYSSSGSESPTFDSASGKRLTVFARMSVSE